MGVILLSTSPLHTLSLSIGLNFAFSFNQQSQIEIRTILSVLKDMAFEEARQEGGEEGQEQGKEITTLAAEKLSSMLETIVGTNAVTQGGCL